MKFQFWLSLVQCSDVVVLDLLVRIEMEPALAALLLRPAVPGDRQRLQAAVGKLDQVLLQRIDAERVLDLEVGELAVGPVGLDEELSVLAEEARTHAVIVEARIVEIAEHRFVGRVLHGVLVLRAAPELALPPGGSRRRSRCRRRWLPQRSPCSSLIRSRADIRDRLRQRSQPRAPPRSRFCVSTAG